MRFHALACDFDGTIAWNGHVDPATVVALHRVRDSGRKVILVSGRELDDLISLCSPLDIFDRVVAENGAVIFRPETNDQRILGDRPPRAFIHDLELRGVTPISVGDVIVATWHPHEAVVLDTIEQHGLEHHVVFNKGAVMVLPAGVNKAAGLIAALHELRLSARNAVCIGDAENDQAMFKACEVSVAVNNALATVKANADIVTTGHHGAGVVELVDHLLATDLRDVACGLRRHDILLGHDHTHQPVVLEPYATRMLLTGAPASGKSSLATGVIERLMAHGYQVCVIDPEGDYGTIPDIIHIGDSSRAPSGAEVAQVLEHPPHSVVVNLLGLPLEERPSFLSQLCPGIRELRERTGRPHWIVIDEAHHLLPQSNPAACRELLDSSPGLLMITVDSQHLSRSALHAVTHVVSVDSLPTNMLRAVAEITHLDAPESLGARSHGDSVIRHPARGSVPVRFFVEPCRSSHRRHRRKYAEGDMGLERSFYFRGPDARHNLRAQNLFAFMDIGEHVDDETWMYHACRGDFSHWIRDAIGDHELAGAVARIEAQPDLLAPAGRGQVRSAIEERYTLPV